MLITQENQVVKGTTQNSAPKDFILHTFNIFNPHISRSINSLFSQTSRYLKAPLTDEQIIEQTFSQRFTSNDEVYQSSQEVESSFAASMGIEGSYGFYSGSVSASYRKDTYQSSTMFKSSFNGCIDCGTITFSKQADYNAIRECLDDKMIAALDAISSLQDADRFGHQYGTHLILGLNLGGTIQLRTEAETADYKSKEEVSIEVKAAYKGVGSIEAAASAAQTLSEKTHSYSFTQTAVAAGGDSKLALAIDPRHKDTIINWGNSCSKDTAYGITNVMEIYQLANNNVAKDMFKQLMDLIVLQQSINYPSVFTGAKRLEAFNEVSVDAITPDPHFRIIGGGAFLDRDYSSFLVDSYPHMDQGTNEISGWTASSHDVAQIADSNKYLTSYAIAIYDPVFEHVKAGLFQKTLTTASGSNRGVGKDSATAYIDHHFLISGGGIKSDRISGANKYVLGSYPSGNNEWTAVNCDYENASTNVELTAFAIGIASNHPVLEIKPHLVVTKAQEAQHTDVKAVLGNGVCIAGGGVLVERATGFGNLVQQIYPSSFNSWEAYDKDHDGHISYAVGTAYAIGFTAEIHI
ncbi:MULTISPECIES: MAC/perforin domain-containing protein [unclassified Mucilaginibacter]|uniref:MAC/perforin domain-containing protein n=1 Tax=unclassified Mucilaginibacter TaxID=2617802 RepID=UPI00095ABC5A|nr:MULTISPECIES: MAC/perforin domain-containing protein [unclassified Mucilaginibacter]OJW17619.1 MAG: hypothetical protein BGO48_08790 [Mucilaginibacter sp. 44-25]PLW91502.1 MAG: hypothetical protein C0154_00895 [Mucilaginibacter sp.]HEK20947.1 hypothetical protein [Bacteroidota bacterium]